MINLPHLPRLTLKPITITQRHKFPVTKGIYYVYPWHGLGRCLYVGRTEAKGGFRARWSRHHRYPQALRIRAVVRFFAVPPRTSSDMLERLENEAIQRHKPLWNGTKPPNAHWEWIDRMAWWVDWFFVGVFGCGVALGGHWIFERFWL